MASNRVLAPYLHTPVTRFLEVHASTDLCVLGSLTHRLSKLRAKHGVHLGTANGYDVYSFPSVETLAGIEEASLRDIGFGYRAPFVVQSARRIVENGGAAWLEHLRELPMEDTRQALLTLHGVGRKVADCIAVFSLDKTSCVPCDTHVWRIACRDMDPTLAECKSLTPVVHSRVNDLFVERFGEHAGWAHSLLFAAELPQFSARLSAEMRAEMQQFREEGRLAKAALKQVQSARRGHDIGGGRAANGLSELKSARRKNKKKDTLEKKAKRERK